MDAIDIRYTSGDSLGRLSFKAPPSSAMEFASRFCANFLYQGYDPFTALDDGTADNGHLIQTQSNYFYYSYSRGTPATYYGNRCYDSIIGQHQILVDKTNTDLYAINFEISAVCQNPLAPHRCDGFPITYKEHSALRVDGPQQTVAAHYAGADSWSVSVKPGTKYQIILSVLKPATTLYGNQLRLTTIAYAADTYCADCWLDVFSAVPTTNLKKNFTGSPSGKTLIRIFWIGEPGTCSIEIREIKD